MPVSRERLVIAASARRRAVLELIRSARRQLVLSIFRCDDAAVLQALGDAAARGVRVRAIATARASSAGRDLDRVQAWLGAHGIEVRRFARGAKYHAKYAVADDRVAIVTTLNFTARCFTRTCDFLLVTRDAPAVSGLIELFDADWSERPPVLTAPEADRLIVGPDLDPRGRMVALLRGARRRIRILDTRVTDPWLCRLLDERRQQGVDVEIARGRAVRPLRAHGRVLLVDDEAAVIGSLALSRAALERRRELSIVIRDPGGVGELDAFWHRHVWSRRRRAAHAAAEAMEMAS